MGVFGPPKSFIMRRYSKKGWETRKANREGYQDFYLKHARRLKGKRCMECGCRLRGNASEVAHIFEKSKYKSVALDDDNILDLCGFQDNNCHGRFDTTFEKMSEMKVFKVALERYKNLRDRIQETGKKLYFFENYIEKE